VTAGKETQKSQVQARDCDGVYNAAAAAIASVTPAYTTSEPPAQVI